MPPSAIDLWMENERQEDRFPTRDPRAGARVHPGDFVAGQEDAEHEEPAFVTPPACGRDRCAHGDEIDTLLEDRAGPFEAPPLARMEILREAHAVALAFEEGLRDPRGLQAPVIERGRWHVRPDGRGIFRRKESVRLQLVEEGEERLALGDDGVGAGNIACATDACHGEGSCRVTLTVTAAK